MLSYFGIEKKTEVLVFIPCKFTEGAKTAITNLPLVSLLSVISKIHTYDFFLLGLVYNATASQHSTYLPVDWCSHFLVGGQLKGINDTDDLTKNTTDHLRKKQNMVHRETHHMPQLVTRQKKTKEQSSY